MFENMDSDIEILAEFITESMENLDDLDSKILSLEDDPNDKELLNHIFRAIHTVKGGSGFLSLDEITKLSHKLENVLDDLRNDVLQITSEILDVILEGIDTLKKLLEILSQECESPGSTKEVVFDLGFIISKIGKIKKPEASSGSEKEPAKDTTVGATPDETIKEGAADEDAMFQRVMEENKATFVTETKEYIEAVDNDLIKLEKGEDVSGVTDRLFRTIHNIKGNAAYLGFAKIERLTHNFENILDELRKDKIKISNEICKLLFNAFDRFKTIFEVVVNTGKDSGNEDITDIINEINRIVSGSQAASEKEGSEGKPEPAPDKDEMNLQHTEKEQPSVKVPDVGTKSIPTTAGSKKTEKAEIPAKSKTDEIEKKKGKAGKVEQTIRVEHSKLDTLMNLIGELIINRNQLEMLSEKIVSDYNLPEVSKELNRASTSLGKISDDLQASIMAVRMIPVGTVFNKFPRVVRDLAKAKHKSIELKISGEDTNLDKTIIEQIGDPMVHLIRNGVDHGIEMPEDRKRANKPPMGTIELRAFQKADNVVIEIEDNGKGMDLEILRKKAVEKGIVSQDDADKLNDEETLNLIFEAGFSTAEQITDISGRGVGMDVVRNNIRKLGGHVYINSKKGIGSKFTLTLPLTLAIIRAIMVKVEHNTFAIPLNAIVETIKIPKKQIKTLKNKKIINLRGEVIGIIELTTLMGMPQNGKDIQDNDLISIVILSSESKKIGLIVDDLLKQQEIVIKPLVDFLSIIPGLSGATILGDGKIVLILDSSEIYSLATSNETNEEAVKPIAY